MIITKNEETVKTAMRERERERERKREREKKRKRRIEISKISNGLLSL